MGSDQSAERNWDRVVELQSSNNAARLEEIALQGEQMAVLEEHRSRNIRKMVRGMLKGGRGRQLSTRKKTQRGHRVGSTPDDVSPIATSAASESGERSSQGADVTEVVNHTSANMRESQATGEYRIQPQATALITEDSVDVDTQWTVESVGLQHSTEEHPLLQFLRNPRISRALSSSFASASRLVAEGTSHGVHGECARNSRPSPCPANLVLKY